MNPLTELRSFLAELPPGEAGYDAMVTIEQLLARCWGDLKGADAGGMRGYKLLRRMEDVTWRPPVLTFGIERHGGFVNGSTRAEIQKWQVDLDRKAALLTGTGRRQIRPMAPRLNVKPIAAEIAAVITAAADDPRIKRRNADSVRIILGDVIPATNNQTTSSRRKRFATELERVLLPAGWRRKDAGSHLIFERHKSE